MGRFLRAHGTQGDLFPVGVQLLLTMVIEQKYSMLHPGNRLVTRIIFLLVQ